ncbi:MAG: hypothetical protein EXR27_17705 [Betaproteobacteria bacterium]|nr:hypothetical protein [Betaproteobacteria bacterium]
MAENQDAVHLQRRARRRLVGAIALVVFVVIFLPIVLDREEKPVRQDLTVQIPSQDAGRFNTRVLPLQVSPKPIAVERSKSEQSDAARPDVQAVAAPTPGTLEGTGSRNDQARLPNREASGTSADRERASVTVTSPSIGQEKERPASMDKDPASIAENERAQAALTDQAWIVPLGTFSIQANVERLQARLAASGVKAYAEPVATKQGEQIRIRAGPYPSRAAAEQAREKLKGMGLPGVGTVASR